MNSLWPWILFNIFVIAMLALDLLVFNKKEHEIRVKEALLWSAFWIALALIFNLGLYFIKGTDPALKFLTGYILEKSLSVDNLFVFLVIFSFFKVPNKYQHKILFWGILGALIMRGLFIIFGTALLHRFEWIMYVFGAILIFSGYKLIVEKDKEIDPEKNPVLKLFRHLMPVTDNIEGNRFFVRRGAKLFATPLFIVLIVVETTDVIFALDSIPAILAITLDPFIVYTSNVFAILGLRALYFALSGVMSMFHLMHYGLGGLLIFIGIKMGIHHWITIPIGVTLSVIAVTLAASILASMVFPKKD